MQILLFICAILTLALDCCFLLNSTIGPTRKFRCVSWLQTPLCSGAFTANVYSRLKFICGFPMVVLLGRCWLQLASHSLQQLQKLQECALLSMIHAYWNLSPHQSSPLLVWVKSPQLNTTGLHKTFLSHLPLLVYCNLFPLLPICLALRLWWLYCYCNCWGGQLLHPAVTCCFL